MSTKIENNLIPTKLVVANGETETTSDSKNINFLEFEDQNKTKILVLERSITFLQSQHQEMLRALQVEVEILKRKNAELQQRLIIDEDLILSPNLLMSNVTNTSVDKLENVDVLKKEIQTLQEHLRIAQDTNKLLKKEIETRRKQSAVAKHNVAETHSPVIRKAEQVKTTMPDSINKFPSYNRIVEEGCEKKKFTTSPLKNENENCNHSNIMTVPFGPPTDLANYEHESSSILANGIYNSQSVKSIPLPTLLWPLNIKSNEAKPCRTNAHQSVRPFESRPKSHCELSTSSIRLCPIKQVPVVTSFNNLKYIKKTSPSMCTGPLQRKLPVLNYDTLNLSEQSSELMSVACNQGNICGNLDYKNCHLNSDGTILRSAKGRRDFHKPKNLNEYVCDSSSTNSILTLPALKQTLDVNLAAQRQRTIELKKKRFANSRNPYIS